MTNPAETKKSLMIPKNIALVFLPPYRPELNPAEKVWWMIKREFKMKLFKKMEELQEAITVAVKKNVLMIALNN